MQAPNKIVIPQPYHLALFRSAVHPEFFNIEERIEIHHAGYEFEAWLFKGGHSLRFEFEGTCVTEIITPEPDKLPERGHVNTLQCIGERDNEQEFADRLLVISSMQSEQLSNHLFGDTYDELLLFAQESDAKIIKWEEGEHRHLSIIDVQRYNKQVHAQGYHLQSEHGHVLRTQSIFEIIAE
ncbi:MAG: hypothetical protein QF444_03975 [Phycisphaerales bacterium]|jgi:hypothetical protein|nr:hypothetical protein [Phycisphaerales bacterium]MDP6693464.1 hypothetical protein [Phycisphaerales bacterium]